MDRLNDKQFGMLFSEEAILKDMGVEVESPDDGCCGMAGAFGFEAGEHYEVAIKAGQRVLIPKVRQAADDELIIADGFSCREQIPQMTERTALHSAQVIQLALRTGQTEWKTNDPRPVC